MKNNLVLYYMAACPFCIRVRDYLEENNINLPLKDIIGDERNREELIKIGGKKQVPCLIINDEALYESRDIIEWFEKNKREL